MKINQNEELSSLIRLDTQTHRVHIFGRHLNNILDSKNELFNIHILTVTKNDQDWANLYLESKECNDLEISIDLEASECERTLEIQRLKFLSKLNYIKLPFFNLIVRHE